MAVALSPILQAAEISIRVTANIIDPATISTSFNPSSNTLWLEAKGLSSYSLDINQSQNPIRVEINNTKLNPNTNQQQLPLDGELALTVNHSRATQNSQKPTVTLNYN
jgi:hypothetical protein